MRTGSLSVCWMGALAIAVASTVIAAESANAPSKTIATATPLAADSGGSPSVSQGQADVAGVDAQAILRRACSTLANARTFTFHAEITFEQMQLRSHMKLQFAGAAELAVRKPNKLAVDYESDLGAKRFWYDGKDFTMFDAPSMMYARVIVPGSIDAMLDRVAKIDNLTIPLSDWALSDPYANFRKQILVSSYVGLGDVGGVACHHLAFGESNIDWQIWITRSAKPLPRKLVINYRTTPGMLQWTAVLSDWKFPAAITGRRFTPQIPKRAVRIKFLGDQALQS